MLISYTDKRHKMGAKAQSTSENSSPSTYCCSLKIGDITVSAAQSGSEKTQGHTSRWFSDVARVYTTAAQDGKVLELDPVSLSVTRELHIPNAYLIQGCFTEIDGTTDLA